MSDDRLKVGDEYFAALEQGVCRLVVVAIRGTWVTFRLEDGTELKLQGVPNKQTAEQAAAKRVELAASDFKSCGQGNRVEAAKRLVEACHDYIRATVGGKS